MIKKLRLGLISFLLAVLFLESAAPGFSLTVNAASINSKAHKQSVNGDDLMSGKQFTLVNMPFNGEDSIIKKYKGESLTINSVQNFDFTPDGKYIFTLGECSTGSGTVHSLLTRSVVPSETGAAAEAECKEAVVLGKYGHGDVLAITQDNLSQEVYNLWVSCKAKSSGHGTQIARLTYKVKGGKGKIVNTVFIKGFEKANVVKGKAAYFDGKAKPEWVECAIDTGSNQIVFRLNMPTGHSNVYLSYNFKKLNKKLDTIGNNGSFNISSGAKWQMAHIESRLVPLSTFQSFAVQGKKLYLAGGNMGLGAEIYVIPYKTQSNYTKIRVQQKNYMSSVSKVISIDPEVTIYDAVYDRDYLEIEGLKVGRNSNGKIDYYVSFLCPGPRLQDSTAIYKFTR